MLVCAGWVTVVVAVTVLVCAGWVTVTVLRADKVVDRIGADHIHGNVHRAVEARLVDT